MSPIIHPRSYHALISGAKPGLLARWLRFALWALSVPHGWGVRLRNALYDHGWIRPSRVAVPVVSVGNLTAGGTGKTPCVEYVARFYRDLGIRAAILSRGYGTAEGPNDEARVLEHNLPEVPHLQGADRVLLAELAVAELGCNVLILDDGMQHRRLARDLEVVLIDCTQPWGHGYLLPRGLLREPPRTLRRADIIVLTRCDQVSAEVLQDIRAEIHRRVPDVPVIESVHRPVEWVNSSGETAPLEMPGHGPAAAFCGIGNPAAFQSTLHSLGMVPALFRSYPDHHAYSEMDERDLAAWAQQQLPADGLLLTTQKDLVKLGKRELGGRPLWALRIGLQITTGQDVFHSLLQVAVPRIAWRVKKAG